MKPNLSDCQTVYHMLEDEKSRQVYLNRLNFMVTSDYNRYIQEITPPHLPRVDKNGQYAFIGEILSSIPTDAKVVLYGAGDYAEKIFYEWNRDQRVAAFCSNNTKKQKTGYLGYPVISPETLAKQKDFFVIVTVVKAAPRKEIQEYLEGIQYPADRVFYLSFPDALDENQYFVPEVMEFGDEEVFLDVGCYNLDTSLKLKQRCPSLKKVYAFEPDPENYKVCLEQKEYFSFSEAEIYPLGTWSHADTLFFIEGEMESSRIALDKTSFSVEVVAIDDIVDPSDKVTFIKMDVEGAELESLKGAKNIILRDCPKLAICIYHKPEDLVDIPLYIKGLVPEYKLYIRHHTHYLGETVLYAVK